MAIFRNTLRHSKRERTRRLDRAFEIVLRVLLVAYFLFVLTAWFSLRPSFQITSVVVEGTQAVDAALVQDIAESQLGRHFLWKIDRNNSFLYPKRAMYSAIKALDPRVKDIDIHVLGKKQLVVRVSEYSPVYLWCPPDSGAATSTLTVGCAFADNEGYLFASAPQYSGSPFLVFVTTATSGNNPSVLPNEEFNKVNIFLQKLSDLNLFGRLVRQSGPHDFTIETDKPWEIRWSSERDPEEDARNLMLVLQNLSSDHMNIDRLRAIDLRFGNKVFYR